jgi:hypothetical protein
MDVKYMPNSAKTPLKNAKIAKLKPNCESSKLSRAVEILDVLNEIYAEADESGQTEEGEEKPEDKDA